MFGWLKKLFSAGGDAAMAEAPAPVSKKAKKAAAPKVKCPKCGKSVTPKTLKRLHGAKCKG